MTNDLSQYIEKLPIYAYFLPGDRTIIGKRIDRTDTHVELKSVLSLETVYDDDGRMQQMIMPFIAHNLSETSVLNMNHIILETEASPILKKYYCDSLLKIQVVQSMTSNQPKHNDSNDRWSY
jgi:hypothetical protein